MASLRNKKEGITMSTRCNVIIKDDYDKIFFVRYCDGDPIGVLPSLKKFMLWIQNGNIRNNAIQAAGWLILIGAKEYENVYVGGGNWKKKETITEPYEINNKTEGLLSNYGWQCGAYDIVPALTKNIEYIYTLDLIDLKITIQGLIKSNKYKTIDTITDFSEPQEIPE